MLSRAQHAAATAAQYDPTIDDVRRRIEAVDARARSLAAELDALRGSKDVSQRKLHDLAHTMAALKTQQAAAVADAHAQVPRVKCVRQAARVDRGWDARVLAAGGCTAWCPASPVTLRPRTRRGVHTGIP